MLVNYVSNDTGATIAVQIPIDDWNYLKKKYPEIEKVQHSVSNAQKSIIDRRLQAIANTPSSLRPIEELFEELDRDAD